MVYLSLKRILATIAGLSALGVVRSAPLDDIPGSNTTSGGLVSRATPAPPHFVIYSDRFVSGLTGPPPVSQVKVREFIIRAIAFTAQIQLHEIRAIMSCKSINSSLIYAALILVIALFRSCSQRVRLTRYIISLFEPASILCLLGRRVDPAIRISAGNHQIPV